MIATRKDTTTTNNVTLVRNRHNAPDNGGMKKMYCQLSVLIARKNLELAESREQLSQRKLARELDISLTTVNKLYNGRPMVARIDPEIVEKVCDYFDCGIADLFVLKEEEIHDSDRPRIT